MKVDIDHELQAAIKVFERFFDVLGQPFSVLNAAGEHVYYNQENADLDECQRKDVLGRHMLRAFPSIHADDNEMLRALRYGEESINHQKSYYTPSGKLIDYQHTTVPLFNSSGKIMGVIESGQDLSRFRKLQRHLSVLNEKLFSRDAGEQPEIIHDSEAMQQVLDRAARLAASHVPVMVIGETGTGKELLANFVHNHSPRRHKPFIALNCGALPVTLIESTLFGTVKGGFTGAENTRGYLELAHGGTLFLDELNALPVDVQGKILRFLQEKTFWKVGGSKELKADIRIIAAMNESPFDMIRQKRLRDDLFYRLEIGMVVIPPLRERKDEIIPLARHFMAKHQANSNKDVYPFLASVEKQLLDYDWPGNVRMLENVIVRSLLLQKTPGPLTELFFNHETDVITHFSAEASSQSASLVETYRENLTVEEGTLTDKLGQYEYQILIEALKEAHGCVAKAARMLGISRGALQYKVKKHNIMFSLEEKRA
ncbi:sigma-54 interaction domain-containing protein [Raoultella planticola]|uniref:sigma-54 interaction domain-containing protein n=1 Tax=Raoultella planticola TaxID=575 RepID=UPI00066CC3E7|nr:sigma 54-interacting transcriptional regulator [Raoultella planticola]EIY2677493.1 sigma 54-interacting transcriptional regulator [Raoultella planticola]ELU1429683.1 sigma 54-interacting transcriptional regulator [Raoultella planticola]MCQ6502871.1 sigma 54-interacting transcriptional regulator [Raoultella planticola]TQN53333.1 PAS domain-containing protein [Raoultella planticola]HBC8114596.1 sigma 54-interacting transcriptional regulator [Raoultella planticola]